MFILQGWLSQELSLCWVVGEAAAPGGGPALAHTQIMATLELNLSLSPSGYEIFLDVS